MSKRFPYALLLTPLHKHEKLKSSLICRIVVVIEILYSSVLIGILCLFNSIENKGNQHVNTIVSSCHTNLDSKCGMSSASHILCI